MMIALRKWVNNNLNGIAKKYDYIVISLGFILLLMDIRLIFNSEFLNGIDGYYYFLQTEIFSKNNSIYFTTYTPFSILFFSLLNVLFNDSVISIKVGTMLFQSFLYIGFFLITNEITKNRWLGLTTVVLCFLSGLHRYMVVEYLNQLGAITVLIWGVFGLIKFYNSKNKWWLFVCIFLFFLSIGSHRSIIPITIVLLLSFILCLLFVKAIRSENKSYLIAFFSTVLMSILFPSILALLQNSVVFFEIQNNITIAPKFPSRLSTLPEIIILLVFSPFCLWLLAKQKKEEANKIRNYFLGTLALFSIILTLNPFLSSELGFSSLGGRLRVLSFAQIALLIPGVFLLAREYWQDKKIQKAVSVVMGIIVTSLLIWSYFLPLPRGVQKEFLENRANLIQALEKNKQNLNKESLIIANHGQQFLVTAITGVRSQQKYPQTSNNSEIYWLIEKMPTTLLDKSMLILFKNELGQNTVIVKDDENWRIRLSNPVFSEQIRRSNRHLDMYIAEQNK